MGVTFPTKLTTLWRQFCSTKEKDSNGDPSKDQMHIHLIGTSPPCTSAQASRPGSGPTAQCASAEITAVWNRYQFAFLQKM